jgi:hypothetical protein
MRVGRDQRKLFVGNGEGHGWQNPEINVGVGVGC